MVLLVTVGRLLVCSGGYKRLNRMECVCVSCDTRRGKLLWVDENSATRCIYIRSLCLCHQKKFGVAQTHGPTRLSSYMNFIVESLSKKMRGGENGPVFV